MAQCPSPNDWSIKENSVQWNPVTSAALRTVLPPDRALLPAVLGWRGIFERLNGENPPEWSYLTQLEFLFHFFHNFFSLCCFFFFPSLSHGAAGGRSVSVASNRGQLRISDSTRGRLPERVWPKSYLSLRLFLWYGRYETGGPEWRHWARENGIGISLSFYGKNQ